MCHVLLSLTATVEDIVVIAISLLFSEKYCRITGTKNNCVATSYELRFYKWTCNGHRQGMFNNELTNVAFLIE